MDILKATFLLVFCISIFSGCSNADKLRSNSPEEIIKKSEQAEGNLAVVENGECNMPIFVFKNAPLYTRKSADELAEYIQKITGVKPEVFEGEPEETPANAIWVGVQPKVKELFPDIDLDFKYPEEIVVAVNDNHILLAGRDRWKEESLVVEGKRGKKFEGIQLEYGTANAVYTFIQDFLDVRWLWPGDLGEDVVKKETLAFAPFEYRYHPQLRSRNGILHYSGIISYGHGRSHDWTRRQRLSLDSLRVSAGHAFNKWWNRFHKTKPEYLALQPDGTRSGFPGGKNAKICQSNPEVWQEWLTDVEKKLEKNPNQRVFNASPNDGWNAGHCICENCRKWDHGEGEPRLFSWEGLGQKYVALSDRHVTFANHCARLLKNKYPDKDYYVVMLSYGHSRPIPIEAVPDENVIINSAALFSFGRPDDIVDRASSWGTTHREQFAGWGNVAKNVIWRPNTPGYLNIGYPYFSIDQTIKDLKLVGEKNAIGITIDGMLEHWGTQGPLYYFMGQLAWDPSKDAEKLVNDYFNRGFAEGADDIKKYWDYMAEYRDKLNNSKKNHWEIYDKGFFNKANSILDDAHKRLTGKPELYQKRVNFLRVGLKYFELIIDNKKYMHKYLKSEKTDQEAENRVRENWKKIEKIATSDEYPFSINWSPSRPGNSRMRNLHPDYTR
ncbi:MAG: DUF4838 domain-containing protein [Bacteroidota bacterium]